MGFQIELLDDCFHCSKELDELLINGSGFFETGFWVEVHGSVPLVVEEKVPKLSMVVLRKEFLDGTEVLERLAHLLPLDVKMSNVKPVPYPMVAVVEGFRLSDFIVMMRELQVDSS
jgi:hypothetical protein